MFTHRSFFKDRKKVFSDPGSRIKPRYSARYDEFGTLVLDEVGTVNVYDDISELPKSNVDFLNRVIQSQEFFASLPPEVKEVYGNDYARFMADFDSSALYRSLAGSDMLDEVVEQPVEKPVKKSSKKKVAETVQDEME